MKLHSVLTAICAFWFFFGTFAWVFPLFFPMNACKEFNPTNHGEEHCKKAFVPSIMVWWMAAKHMFCIHTAMTAFTVWHNTFGRVSIPLLQMTFFFLVVGLVGNMPHLINSKNAGEI